MTTSDKWLLRGVLIYVAVVSVALIVLAVTQPDWLKNIPVPRWFR